MEQPNGDETVSHASDIFQGLTQMYLDHLNFHPIKFKVCNVKKISFPALPLPFILTSV